MKYIKDLIEIHHFKQRDGESMEAFMEPFKAESMHVNGAPECMRIPGSIHSITNPNLIKRLNDNIPKSVDEMMSMTPAFLWGERIIRQRFTQSFSVSQEISFPPLASSDGQANPMVIEAEVEGHLIHHMITNSGTDGIRNLEEKVDSRLVANQVNGSYVAKEQSMIQYLEKAKALINRFKKFFIEQVLRSKSKKAYALSKIASTSFAHLTKQVLVEVLKEKSIEERQILAVVEEEGDSCMTPLLEYRTYGTLPAEPKRARAIKIKSRQYTLVDFQGFSQDLKVKVSNFIGWFSRSSDFGYRSCVIASYSSFFAKTTAWNEFNNTMASAIICLADNQKFNFSKYIFDNMVKSLVGGVKFYLFPRVLQVFLDKKVEGMTRHKELYIISSHTKKVFANLKTIGAGFSGVITPLFDTMMVQASADMGDTPVETHQTPNVLDLQEAKAAQANKIVTLKKKVTKLNKQRKSRSKGLMRLKKIGSCRRVKSPMEKDGLGAQEDASKHERVIKEIDQNAEIALDDETQGRTNE
nr:reverse transcriptase domain-containing protein [Tanacetum cinerariifolium]